MTTKTTLYAVADPNWGEGYVPLISTISETTDDAIKKALLTDERGANLYSGASLVCVPQQPGTWERLMRHGYRLVAVDLKVATVFSPEAPL